MYRYFYQILMKLEFFFEMFSKNTKTSNFLNIRPVAAELFHADGQMDGQTDTHVTNPTVTFCNFPNEPRNLLSPDKCS